MKTVLGIDLGTQSIKVVFYDYQQQSVVASAASPLAVDRNEFGAAEQNTADWLSALKQCFLSIPDDVKASITAIGVSGQQHGLVALDEQNQALYAVKLWCDTATQKEVDEITHACGGRDALIEHVGNPIVTGYTAPKIRWLKNHRPEAYKNLAHILLPHDYINFVLTGAHVMEFGDASGTGLLDVRQRQWSAAVINALDEERDLSKCLPDLIDADQMVGRTHAECAREFGIPEGVPVSAGGGDNMMGAIGTGNVVPGVLTMSLGTSGTLYAYSDTPIVDPNGNVAAFCSSTGGWLPLICTMNCTLATELIRGPLCIDLENFEATVAAANPGSDGIITLPFFSGERTPNLPSATGTILGLTADNCLPENILRSHVEAAVYGLKFGLEELRKLGVEASEIVLTGGGANSAQWRQIVADVCELDVAVLDQAEGAALGAALQALWAFLRSTGEDISIAEITTQHLSKDPSATARPNPDLRAVYRDGYARYWQAVQLLTPYYTDK